MSWVEGRDVTEVIIIAEGQTEEQFIKRVVAPSLKPADVFLKPLLLKTSRDAQGGAISFDRLKTNERNTLRQHPNAVLSTFLDLYGLDTSFPDFEPAKALTDVHARVRRLESALHAVVVDYVACPPERFVPHIQPYEFDGLLFADVDALSQTEPGWSPRLSRLASVRASFASPEHINDSYDTKPSKRLEDLLSPRYHKVRHGPLAAQRVSLAAMESECTHFAAWMRSLRSLAAPSPPLTTPFHPHTKEPPHDHQIHPRPRMDQYRRPRGRGRRHHFACAGCAR